MYLRWDRKCRLARLRIKADDTFVTASATPRVYDKSVSSGARANKRRRMGSGIFFAAITRR